MALVLVGLSVWGYGYMRQGFFPDMVYDQLYMEYKLPEGTNSTRVKADLEEIRRYLKSRPEIRSVAASIGGTPARYNLVRSIATPSHSSMLWTDASSACGQPASSGTTEWGSTGS